MISRNSITCAYPTRRLGDVVEFLDSMRRPVTESDRRAGEFPYYGANGPQGTIDDFIFDEPLVLLAEDGGHFGTPDRGIAYRVSGKTWVNNHAHVLRPKAGIDLGFLCRVLENYDVTPWVTGTTRGKLTQAGASQIVIPVPPLPEQQRIAEILDKADALRAKRRAALAQLDTLTQSIFLDMFGDPATNPNGWPQVSIGDHTSKIGSGATPLGGEEAYKASGIALIRSMNVRDGAFLRDGLAFIDEEQASRLDGVVVEADDVLLNITGASVARVCRAPADVRPARVNQHVAIIRPTATFSSLFLEQCLLSPAIKQRLLRIARAGATREAITKSAIEQFTVIRPPRELQNQFAARVDASERTYRQMHCALTELNALFASLRHRAFRGEL